MKGILLAGGSGTRLYPLTKTTSKQLLPVYDKPMIYYPLSTLMLFGIKDILVISTPRDLPNIEKLFGNGSKFGLNLQYKVQKEPNGIAQAFILGADFIGNSKEDVCLILGDNIFYMGSQFGEFNDQVKKNSGTNATIFAYHVTDPERFGVVEFDENRKAVSIEEKPAHPKSNYAVTGLYFYDNRVCDFAKQLKPSARGELEITDLNKMYLERGELNVEILGRGFAWLDTGTHDSMLQASLFVQTMELNKGVKISCLEEIAFNQGFITKDELLKKIERYGTKNDYYNYVRTVIEHPTPAFV